MSKWLLAGVLLALVAVLLAGCGGGNDQVVFQNVLERSTWRADGDRLAFTSLGGNALQYVYAINANRGNLVLLTPSDNDEDLTDEGGKQPAWAPDGNDLAIVARRAGGTQSIWLIDPVGGAAQRETKLTPDDAAVAGADAQPSWSPDSSQIVYVSTKNSGGIWEIHIINRDGSGDHVVTRTGDPLSAQWPVFTPDGANIVYQSGIAGTDADTALRVVPVAGGPSTPIGDTATNGFRDEAPSVFGTRVVFHSNRSGDFDIWTIGLDGTGAAALTDDARSDGYPVWSPDGSRIAFTRDRELWTMAADGSDEVQVTRRFQ